MNSIFMKHFISPFQGASSSGKRKNVNLSPAGPVRKKTRRSEEETVVRYLTANFFNVVYLQ
jgi:hypothetical protein